MVLFFSYSHDFGKALSFDDTSGLAGTTYYYWVKACNIYGCSDYSSYNTGYRAGSPPGIPTNVIATNGTYTDRVRITWNAVSGATSYEVYRADSAGGTKTNLSSPTATTYDDFWATTGTTYYYWVKACNTYGCSDYSSYNTGYRAGSPPGIPTGVAATNSTYTDKIRVTWNSVSGATFYEVYRADSAGGSKTKRSSPTGTTYDDLSATAGKTYYYWVKACNTYGCSDFSQYDTGLMAAMLDLSISGLRMEPAQPRAMDEVVHLIFTITNNGNIGFSPARDGLTLTAKLLKGSDYRASFDADLNENVSGLLPGSSTVVVVTFFIYSPDINALELQLTTDVTESDLSNNVARLSPISVLPAESTVTACYGLLGDAMIAYLMAHGIEGTELATVGKETAVWAAKLSEYVRAGDLEQASEVSIDWLKSLLIIAIGELNPLDIVIDVLHLLFVSIKESLECGDALANFFLSAEWELEYWLSELGESLNVVLVESPIYVRVKNDAGQHIGFNPDGSIVNEIGGARVSHTSGGEKLITYPGHGTALVEIFGYDSGTFNLELTLVNADRSMDVVRYTNVPVTQHTTGVVDAQGSGYILELDDDGNGSVDRVVAPTDVDKLTPGSRLFLPLAVGSSGTPMPVTYALEVSAAGQGTITIAPQKPAYRAGDRVRLTAVAAEGWKFAGWIGDVATTDNPAELVIAGNHEVLAVFEEDEGGLASRLVTCLPFDGHSDDLVNLVSGVPHGNATFVTERKLGSHAVSVNQADLEGWIEVPESPPTTGNFTYSLWVYPRDAEADRLQLAVSSWYRYYNDALRLGVSDGRVFYGIEPGWAAPNWNRTSIAPVASNTWYHAVVVKENSTLTLYLNGEYDSHIAGLDQAITTSPNSYGIGRFPGTAEGSPPSFDGLVDDLAVWSRALSAAEVRNLYNNGEGLACSEARWGD